MPTIPAFLPAPDAPGRTTLGEAPEPEPAPDEALVADEVDAVRASTLGVAGLTALRLLRTAGALAGKRVLLTGASGGVGHFVVELATAQGALVTAVSSSPERGERLLALGAAEVVDDVEAAQGPFEVVLESVGGRSLEAALARLAPRGTLLWFGQAGREPASLDFSIAARGAPFATI